MSISEDEHGRRCAIDWLACLGRRNGKWQRRHVVDRQHLTEQIPARSRQGFERHTADQIGADDRQSIQSHDRIGHLTSEQQVEDPAAAAGQ